MTIMQEERDARAERARQRGEKLSRTGPAAARKAGTGIIIDPERLRWHREERSWSPRELADIVTRLGWRDENGEPVSLTRDAINKFETGGTYADGHRNPRPVTLRALAEALSGDLVAEYDDDTGQFLGTKWVPCADERCRVLPRHLMPSQERLPPHANVVEREARREHLRQLRLFAEEHCIPYRYPDTRRPYYHKGLQDAFTLAVSGASGEAVAAAVQRAIDEALPSRAGKDRQPAGQLVS